jgi:hypothetical protein
MDWTHQRPDISPPNGAVDDIVYCPSCSGFVISVNALEWSQFALGQLVALGIATFLLALLVLGLSLFSLFG